MYASEPETTSVLFRYRQIGESTYALTLYFFTKTHDESKDMNVVSHATLLRAAAGI